MEDLLPKVIEYGVLGFLCCYLVMKGVAAMQALTKVIEKLTETVNQLQVQTLAAASKIDSIDHKLELLDQKLIKIDLIDQRTFELEQTLHSFISQKHK